MSEKYSIPAYTLSCSAGIGLSAVGDSVRLNKSGLSNSGWPDSTVDCWLGKINNDALAAALPEARWNSRNNRLALLGLQQDGFEQKVRNAIDTVGAHRVGLVLGTSTSSIGRTERAYTQLTGEQHFTPEFLQPEIHNPHSTGEFLADYLGLTGPCITISTACSSSAKAFATATRWIEANLVDAVIVGGVDSLCLSVIYGFNSLQLISEQACKPFDAERSGISLGEAAGFALLTKDTNAAAPKLLGYGESTDAWHMSTPHPEGLGARLAMTAALERAGLTTTDIDYLNLHGTGTRANDDSEGKICADLFSENERLLASATKGITGHTLGAAGIVEAIFALESIARQVVPGTVNTTQPETALAPKLVLETRSHKLSTAMTNSFGFGGNNCTLIFGSGN